MVVRDQLNTAMNKRQGWIDELHLILVGQKRCVLMIPGVQVCRVTLSDAGSR